MGQGRGPGGALAGREVGPSLQPPAPPARGWRRAAPGLEVCLSPEA